MSRCGLNYYKRKASRIRTQIKASIKRTHHLRGELLRLQEKCPHYNGWADVTGGSKCNDCGLTYHDKVSKMQEYFGKGTDNVSAG